MGGYNKATTLRQITAHLLQSSTQWQYMCKEFSTTTTANMKLPHSEVVLKFPFLLTPQVPRVHEQ